jgi:hypothetical protein
MRVTIHTEITQHETCGTCIEDEHASPGSYCQCIDTDVRLEVVGEVVADEANTGHPSDHIEILSIVDADTGQAWSPMEIDLLERNAQGDIFDSLWLQYLETEPGEVLRRKAKRLGDLLATHVDLAVKTKTEGQRITRMLERVAAAILDVRRVGVSS